LRGLATSKKYFYSKPDSKVPGEKRPFYYVVRDHFSKVLTPFEAIERPAAFMALMRLDDNFRILSPEGYTLPMHILKAKNIIKNHKRAMLDFIAHFDQDVFDVPSGPEGLVPAIYCLKTDNMFLFNGMIWKQSIFRFKSTSGKSIMDYCYNKHLQQFTTEQRLQVLTEVDGALNTFLMRNIKGKKKHKFFDTLVIEALETVYKSGKQDQLKEFAEIVSDRALAVFMLQVGYRSDNLNKFSCHSPSGNKEHFDSNFDAQTTFDFVNLPAEILELIMVELSARDILSLFIIDKKMREWFKRFDRNALWQQILTNSKLSLDGDIPMPSENFKKYVLNTERCKHNWRRGKFREKTLIEIPEYTRDLKLDDNWLCALSSTSCIHLVNMHTDAHSSLQFTDGARYANTNHCIVESPPYDPPLMALYNSVGKLYYGRVGSSMNGVLQLPTAQYNTPLVYAQSNDRVVTSKRLQVVDLNAQCIVAQLTEEAYIGWGVIANPFNRFMSVGCSYSALYIFDKDMRVVQSLKESHGMSNISMIDEFTIAVNAYGKGITLFDIRNLRLDNFQVLLGDAGWGHQYTVDARNQRMLVASGPYKLTAQIDLKTRQWERVWKPFGGTYEKPFPVINGKYLIAGHRKLYTRLGVQQTTFIAYDFSV
jgi:hypothetical protein